MLRSLVLLTGLPWIDIRSQCTAHDSEDILRSRNLRDGNGRAKHRNRGSEEGRLQGLRVDVDLGWVVRWQTAFRFHTELGRKGRHPF